MTILLRPRMAASLLIVLVCGGAAAGTGGKTTSDPAFDVYAKPGRRVALPDRRRINLRCSGRGPTTVLLESGLGFPSYSWRKVQPSVARFTRVCSYDRAGLGFSDPGPLPRTTTAITGDLIALIDMQRLRPPLVVVGSSMGGQVARLLAFRRPGQVAGLILVDPYVEGQAAQFAALVPTIADELEATRRSDEICLDLLKRRALSAVQAEKRGCIDGPLPNASPELAQVIRNQRLAPSTAASVYSEAKSLDGANENELATARRDLGAMPILVLTAGKDFEEYGPINAPHLLALHRDGHRAMAALSSDGAERLVASADHVIQASNPLMVITAIREIVTCARRNASRVRPSPRKCLKNS